MDRQTDRQMDRQTGNVYTVMGGTRRITDVEYKTHTRFLVWL